MDSRTYEQGLVDGIQVWGKNCGRQASCETCPIGVIRGADLTCQEYASRFPQKFMSMLQDMNSEKYTYEDEFRLRMPHIGLNLDEMIECGVCRKLVFEGYADCEEGDCVACWHEQYAGDVTVPPGGMAEESKPSIELDEDDDNLLEDF